MLQTKHLSSTLLCLMISLMSLLEGAAGQSCTEGETTIRSTSTKICQSGNVTIECQGFGELIEIFRDGDSIFNGTSLAPELQSQSVTVTQSTEGSGCLTVSLTFEIATAADTGNYTCRTNATDSNVIKLVVEAPVARHDCVLMAATGPVVENGENVTCSSTTGQPSFVNIHPEASRVDTGSTSVAALAFYSSSSSLLTTLQCDVTSLPTGACPSTMTSCIDRVIVVPNPVESYLSLTPTVEVIQRGTSASFFCTTNLQSAKVVVVPLTSSDAIQPFIHTHSVTNVQIVFHNITVNYTEPVVECRLEYSSKYSVSAFGSVVVLHVEDVIATTLPTTMATSRIQTTMPAVRTELTTMASTRNEITTEPLSTTEEAFVTTIGVYTGGFPKFDTRLLIIGLVIGLLVFIAVIILCALLFRQKARKRGAWTVASTSRRRGQAEVASTGVEGRLEWETDINPLVMFETTTIDTAIDHHDNDDNGSITYDDLADQRITRSNGYAKHIDNESDEPAVLTFNAVIENHAARKTNPSSSPEDAENVDGITNQGYSPENHSIIVHHADSSDIHHDPKDTAHTKTPHDIPMSTIPNGHTNRESDEIVSDDVEDDSDFVSLNFVDATKMDVNDSEKDWDSGYSLGRDSVLSEIDEDAINIISV